MTSTFIVALKTDMVSSVTSYICKSFSQDNKISHNEQKTPQEIKANDKYKYYHLRIYLRISLTVYFILPYGKKRRKNLCHLHFFVFFVCCSVSLYFFASNICFRSIFLRLFGKFVHLHSICRSLKPETKEEVRFFC